jgi:hypothetical protein
LSEASFAAPGYFEQRRESAFGGQVNGCPFGSFWASKMNVKKIKIILTLYGPHFIYHQPTRIA